MSTTLSFIPIEESLLIASFSYFLEPVFQIRIDEVAQVLT